MSDPSTMNETRSRSMLDFLKDSPKSAGYILLVAALAAGILTGLCGFQWFKDAAMPICVWGAGVTFVLLVGGVFLVFFGAEEMDASMARILVLTLGGLIGLFTSVGGVLFIWIWWSDVYSWLGEPGTGKHGSNVVLALACLIGGMMVMFASLHLARAAERTDRLLRVLLYGYNSVLTSGLVLLILVIANVMVAARNPQPIDFTRSQVFTLSDVSGSVLRHLDKPVQIVVILPPGPMLEDMRIMLKNCQAQTSHLDVVEMSPNEAQGRIMELAQRYPKMLVEVEGGPGNQRGLSLSNGVLVIYNVGQKREEYEFIKVNELFSRDRATREPLFLAEKTLMTTLSHLAVQRKKPVVYVTQGNGELDLGKMDASLFDYGAGQLRDRLEKRNFDVRPLPLGLGATQVPDDATMVLVAGPRQPLPESAVKALTQYMTERHGKLMVLLDVVPGPDNKMMPTGLEPLMAKFGVMPGNERLISLGVREPDPTLVYVVANDKMLGNPIVNAFLTIQQPFRFTNVRPVETSPAMADRRKSPYRVDPILEGRSYVYAEPNLSAVPSAADLDAMRKDKTTLQTKNVRNTPVAVSVWEPGVDADNRPIQKARMVVVGNSTFATNRNMVEGATLYNFDLCAALLAWLGDRPPEVAIPPKSRSSFRLDSNVSFGQLFLYPAVLILAGVITLGAGVWLVRRR